MALSRTINLDNGLVASDAYIKVVSVVINDKQHATANVELRATAESKAFSIKGYSFNYVLDGNNAWSQAYEYLKTLSEFENSTDV